MLNTRHILWAVFMALAFLGCGGNQSLSGKVTFSDDGSPLTKGVVIFTTATHNAQGVIKKDGTYVVGFQKLNDGIPRGDYKVYIGGAEDVISTRTSDGGESNRYVPLIDSKYFSSENSGLTFKADGSQRTFDIQVDRPGK